MPSNFLENLNWNCSFKVVFVTTERMGSFTQTKNLKNFSFKLHKRPKGEKEIENFYSDLDLIAFKSKLSESFLSSQVSLFALTLKNFIKS